MNCNAENLFVKKINKRDFLAGLLADHLSAKMKDKT